MSPAGGRSRWGTSAWPWSRGENVPPPDPENCLLEFAVEDALAQYRRVTGLGLSPQGEPADLPWGCRYFAIKDPDGNCIDFVQKL